MQTIWKGVKSVGNFFLFLVHTAGQFFVSISEAL